MLNRFGLLLGATFALLGGCAVDTAVDCQNICERYAECFDEDLHIANCRSRCEGRVDSGDDDNADACDSCLDDNPGCVEGTLSCGTLCAGLVAP